MLANNDINPFLFLSKFLYKHILIIHKLLFKIINCHSFFSFQHQVIKIDEMSLSADKGLDLDITIQQRCKCTEHHIFKESELCNMQGDFSCGSCSCYEGYSGRSCKCNLKDHNSYTELENECRLPTNDTDIHSPICSDRGYCDCGECFCNKGYAGQYCECLQCPIIDGKICGGSDRATCNCGTCICDNGWSGEDCSCTANKDTCIAPHNSEICSGNGDCKCGTCDCSTNFHGDFCEREHGLEASAMCSYYESCVRCMILRKQQKDCANLSDICRDSYNQEFIAEFFTDISDDEVKCIIRLPTGDDEQCDHQYTYRIDHIRQSQIKIVFNECKRIGTAFFALGLVITTILLGLVVVVVLKATWVIQDRREYAQFVKNREKENSFNMSPIYKSPITTYKVPQYIDNEYTDTIRSS